jgi:23S rRNA (pseudouridine1915-N3)-methyltransferase
MRIAVHAVGRMKAGPERELADRYFDRFAKAGPSVGLEWMGVTETPESRAASAAERKREEAARLERLTADGAMLVLLDERGRSMGSEEFAGWLGKRSDGGQPYHRS